jgi:hypothetical protein
LTTENGDPIPCGTQENNKRPVNGIGKIVIED